MAAEALTILLLRGLHLAALISLFGTLLFAIRLAGAPTERSTALRQALRRLSRASAALAIVTGIAWLLLVLAPFATAAGGGDTTAAAWLPALNTQFGRWLLLRLGLLAVVLALSLARRGSGVALLLAAAALALQPQLAHAGAIGGRLGLLLCGSEALHMLAAGAWLGGLLPLVLALAMLPAEPAARVCRRFSRLAASAVIILAVTGSVQGRVLIGTEAALFHSAYGHVALVKLALVVCAIGLGAVSRFVLLPLVPAAATAGRRMQLAVAVETVFGLAVVLAAAWLASLGPAAEMDPGALDWRPGLPSLTAIVALALVAFALLRRPA